MVIASWVSGCPGALAGALVAAIMVIDSAPAPASASTARALCFGLMKRSTSLRSSTGAYGVSCRARDGRPWSLGPVGRRALPGHQPGIRPCRRGALGAVLAVVPPFTAASCGGDSAVEQPFGG